MINLLCCVLDVVSFLIHFLCVIPFQGDHCCYIYLLMCWYGCFYIYPVASQTLGCIHFQWSSRVSCVNNSVSGVLVRLHQQVLFSGFLG